MTTRDRMDAWMATAYGEPEVLVRGELDVPRLKASMLASVLAGARHGVGVLAGARHGVVFHYHVRCVNMLTCGYLGLGA